MACSTENKKIGGGGGIRLRFIFPLQVGGSDTRVKK